MKKRIHFLFALLIVVTHVFANDAAFKILGETIIPQDGYTIPCMGYKDTVLVEIDRSKFNPTTINSWSTSGDLGIVEENTYGLDAVHVYSKGPARGGITIRYDHASCGGYSQGFIINKSFHPDTFKLAIKGPECIIDTQEVVYSVEPILTKNLGANIGIDSYIWNVLQTPRPPFVDSILYVSGDTSSVTFRVSHVDPNNLPFITLTVGACNTNTPLTLQLGNSTPKPQMIDTMYHPVGKETFKVGVVKPDTALAYTWSCKPASSFTIEPFGRGDSAMVTIEEGGEKATCEVFVSAIYRRIQCNTSADTMVVMRTWGGDVYIADSTKIENSCYAVNLVDTPSYTFTVKGSSIPTETSFDWVLPQGWHFRNGEESHGKTISIYPDRTARLVDAISVKPSNPNDPARPAPFPIYIKPDNIPVNRIKQDSCLNYNSEGGVYVDTTGLNMPDGVTFEWDVPETIKGQSGGTDTLRFTPYQGLTSIQVRAKGIGGCDGEYTSYSVTYKPQKPSVIVCPDCECISVNMPDTLKFYVANEQSTQTYSWSYTSNLSVYRTKNDTIELITNGAPNAQDTVWVKAIQDNQNCPQSDSIYKAITIGTTDRFIDYDGEDGGYIRVAYLGSQDKYRTEAGLNFYWYLLYQGKIVIDAMPDSNKRLFFLFEDYDYLSNVLGTTNDLPNDYVIVCEYTPSNSCNRVRLTYPQGALPPNFTPNDTLHVSDLPLLSPSRAPKRRIANTLNLHPNPTDNILYLNLDDNSNFGIRISNIDGELVYSSKDDNASRYELNISSLPQGKYIVVAVRNGERIVSGKFVKK